MVRPVALALVVLCATLALASACGDNEKRCAVRCIDGCPDGTACSAGFCAPGGGTCEPDFARVHAGTGFACALDSIARLWCWGGNRHRQLEDSDRAAIPRAVVVGDRRWDAVSVGGGHICALRDRELWCWGRNDRGQVFRDGMTADFGVPVRIGAPDGPTEWDSVSAGLDHTCAISSGELFCWGAGTAGKLGNGLDGDNVPTRVQSPIADWATVVAGGRHTCARSAAAGLHCWGDGGGGQLGTGTFTGHPVPKPVQLAAEVRSFALGLQSTCATTAAGELMCWGLASEGALGDPAVVDPDGAARPIPVRASELGGWDEVAAGQTYACGRRGDEIWCWGSSRGGGTGDGRWTSRRAWGRVATGAASISIGWNATADDPSVDEGDLDLSCAAGGGGGVRCWGDNREGQLAQGTVTRAAEPAEIAGGHAWSAIAAGPAHACGVAGGETYCWGQAELGQVAGTMVAPCVPDAPCDAAAPVRVAGGAASIAPGRAHTCTHAGAAIECWGDNSLGQTGAPASPSALPPRAVPGAWASLLAAGADGACAITGGQTWCWGRVLSAHEPAHEPALDGALALALGPGFGCALDAAGALACFGDNASAAFGNGGAGMCGDGACNARETAATCAADCGAPPLTRLGRAYAALDAGWTRPYACGLRADGKIECWGDNTFGQASKSIGEGFVIHPVDTPFVVPGLDGCTRLATGDSHACAICAGGGLWCWGDRRHGELGAGGIGARPATTPRAVAADLAPGDAWVEVTAGSGFTCARTAMGRGYCWGTSSHGALGIGAAGSNLPLPIQLAY